MRLDDPIEKRELSISEIDNIPSPSPLPSGERKVKESAQKEVSYK
jgi:hypothetical protein